MAQNERVGTGLATQALFLQESTVTAELDWNDCIDWRGGWVPGRFSTDCQEAEHLVSQSFVTVGGGLPGAHGCEGCMAWRVQEGDEAVRVGHGDLEGADALGDAPGLPYRHWRLAQGIQQCGLPMIHMAHDGHYRGPGHGVIVAILRQAAGLLNQGQNAWPVEGWLWQDCCSVWLVLLSNAQLAKACKMVRHDALTTQIFPYSWMKDMEPHCCMNSHWKRLDLLLQRDYCCTVAAGLTKKAWENTTVLPNDMAASSAFSGDRESS